MSVGGGRPVSHRLYAYRLLHEATNIILAIAIAVVSPIKDLLMAAYFLNYLINMLKIALDSTII